MMKSCQLVADLLATRPTSTQQVVVMEFGKRHDTTDTTCQLVTNLLYGLVVYVADLLWTCYGETGLMDCDLYWAAAAATISL